MSAYLDWNLILSLLIPDGLDGWLSVVVATVHWRPVHINWTLNRWILNRCPYYPSKGSIITLISGKVKILEGNILFRNQFLAGQQESKFNPVDVTSTLSFLSWPHPASLANPFSFSLKILYESMKVLVAQLHLLLCDPMDCSPPCFSVHGIFWARIVEWVAIPFSRGSSWPRDWTQVCCITGRFFTIWPTRED